MKRITKEIAVVLLLVGSIVFFAFTIVDAPKESPTLTPPNSVTKTEERAVSLAYYSPKETQKVAHKLDSLLKRINKRHDFHGAVLVAKKNKIVYQNQVGYADFRKKIPLDKDAIFQLASVSKQFTATAIMLLKEQEKLQLSDTVTKYFPNFPYKAVTIKNLLHHTAGLPKYFWIAEHEWAAPTAPTNAEMIAILPNSKAGRFFRPGRNFDYSNTGYFVLASIVEQISGLSFQQFLQTHFFDPLAMKNTFAFSYQHDSIREKQLIGYRLYRGWRHLKIRNTVNDGVVGDKNIYATAEDLYKWTYALNSGKIISKNSLELMYTKGKTIYGRHVPYGFGFRLDRNDEAKIYHYGKWNGFSTALTNYLDEDLVVIVLEHTSYNSMKHLNRKIKKIVDQNFTIESALPNESATF